MYKLTPKDNLATLKGISGRHARTSRLYRQAERSGIKLDVHGGIRMHQQSIALIRAEAEHHAVLPSSARRTCAQWLAGRLRSRDCRHRLRIAPSPARGLRHQPAHRQALARLRQRYPDMRIRGTHVRTVDKGMRSEAARGGVGTTSVLLMLLCVVGLLAVSRSDANIQLYYARSSTSPLAICGTLK